MRKKLFALLLSLCLLLPTLSWADENAIVYVNDLVTGGDEIEVRFTSTSSNAKSDATILLCRGAETMQVLIVDGGLANARCLLELTNLRRSILEENGINYKDKNYKLRLTLVVTHCHKDHVAELYTSILTSNFFEVEALYLPPATELPVDNTYDDSANGDNVHRIRLLDAMSRYAPNAPIYVTNWGETTEFDLSVGHAKVYAPVKDYGTAEGVAYCTSVYYATATAAKIRSDMPVAVVNANSQWLRVSCHDVSVLFPGDVMKKNASRTDEPMDEMIAAYGEELRSDIIKYPHHGISRNPAAAPLTQSLYRQGGIVVLTTKDARDNGGKALAALGTPFVTTEDGDYTFIMDANGYHQAEAN